MPGHVVRGGSWAVDRFKRRLGIGAKDPGEEDPGADDHRDPSGGPVL
jgi:hypothetical protein